MRLARIAFSILAVCFWSQFCLAAGEPQSTPSVQTNPSSMPVAFTENKGQWPDSILFRADAGGAVVWITRTGVYYQLFRRIEKSGEEDPTINGGPQMPGKFGHERDSVETMLVKAAFVGSNPEPEVVAEGLMEYRYNYFIGNDPEKWATDVPNYERVTMRGVYEGIDIQFAGGANGLLTYNYRVSADADITTARLEYAGVAEMVEGGEGIVIGETAFGRIEGILAAPRGDARVTLNARVAEDGEGKSSDSEESMSAVRSPEAVALVYSTYLGGADYEWSYGIAVDGSGSAYVTGHTISTDFPMQKAYDGSHNGDWDLFVSKLSTSGSSLVYSTYLGGGSDDRGHCIAVDGSGSAYVTGETWSTDFPMQNAYDGSYNGYEDVFVSKLSSNGSGLVYSTYLGGSFHDVGYSIAVDGTGSAYVTGVSSWMDFPTQNPYQTYQDIVDAFVTKLSGEGVQGFCDGFTGMFCDDFAGGADPTWWTIEGGCTWDATATTFHAVATGQQVYCTKAIGDMTWRNYDYEVKVKGNDGVDKVVNFRVQDEYRWYGLNLRSSDGQLLLTKRQDAGMPTVLAQAAVPNANGVWYSLKVTCVDETFHVYVDGVEKIAFTDTADVYYSGGVGITCYTGAFGTCDIEFDDVRVTDPYPQFSFEESVVGEYIGDQVAITGYLSTHEGAAYIPASGMVTVEDPARDTVASCTVQPDGSFIYSAPTAGTVEGLHLYVFACSTAGGLVREAYGVALKDTTTYDEKAGGVREKVWWLSRKINTTAKTVRKNMPKATDFLAFRAANSAYQASGKVLGDGLVAMFGAMKADITTGWQRTFDGGNPVVEGSKIQLQKCNLSQPWNLGSCVLGIGGLTWTGLSVPWNTMVGKIDGGLDLARQANLIDNCTYQGAKSGVEVGDIIVGIFGFKHNKPQSWKKLVEEGFGFSGTRQLVENRFNECLGGAQNPFPSLGVIFNMHGFDAVLMGLYPKIDKAIVIRGHSPIEITVSDPLGRRVSPTLNEIPGADYYVFDSDLDGDSEQVVIVPLDSVLGDVTVEVAPQAGADPDEIVSVVAEYTYYQEPLVLVDSLPLSTVPAMYEPLPTFENLAPEAFDLLTVADTVFSGLPASLHWRRAVDPNPGHIVSYRVVIATDPTLADSAVVEVGADTAYSFGGGLWKSAVDTATYYWRVYAHDDWNATVASTQTRSFRVEWKCGDINADRSINVADLTSLVNYLFKGGLKPPVEQAADVNGSSGTNVSDLTYMVNYLFRGGPAPVACP